MAWSGSEFGLVWEDGRDDVGCLYNNTVYDCDTEVYFARIDANGTKIGADLRVSHGVADSFSGSPSLTFSGGEWAVAWKDSRNVNAEIYFARIQSNGLAVILEQRITYDANSSKKPALTWSGLEYGLGWGDYRDGDSEIYFQRIAADGTTVGGHQKVSTPGEDSFTTDVAWSGSEFGLAWRQNPEIHFRRVSTAGAIVGAVSQVTADPDWSESPSIAWMNPSYGVAWSDLRDDIGGVCPACNAEIYYAVMRTDGLKQGQDVRITYNQFASFSPSLAFSGNYNGLAWSDNRSGDFEIYFKRVSPAGVNLDHDFRVTSGVSDAYEPSLVWMGNGYGVAWCDDNNIDSSPCDRVYFSNIWAQ